MGEAGYPPYPGSTKELSVNYTAGGDPFAIADGAEDDLDPRDLYYLARAFEDHQHGTGRGLAVNRIGTTTTPQNPGDIGVVEDDFVWWGAVAGAPLSAVNRETDQTVNGVKRFNQPLLLPRQGSAPAAPGGGLGYLYLGPSDRLYVRTGDKPPTPVDTPALVAAPLAWQTTQGAGQAQQQQITLNSSGVWTLGYRQSGADWASLFTVAPPTYGGSPITVTVDWTAPAAAGRVNFTLHAKVTAVGGDLLPAWTEVATVTGDASGAAWTHQQAVLSWTTGLPAAGNTMHLALQRDTTREAAGGTAYPQTVSVLMATFGYGA